MKVICDKCGKEAVFWWVSGSGRHVLCDSCRFGKSSEFYIKVKI
jgi:hypothetical protein